MPHLVCPSCAASLSFPEAIGKRYGRCPRCHTCIPLPPPVPIPVATEIVDEDEDEETIPHHISERSQSGGFYLRPSRVHLLLWMMLYVVPIILAWLFGALFTVIGAEPIAMIFVCPAVFWPLLLFPCRWLARYLAAWSTPFLRCPRCELEISTISRWSVGGFNSPWERHILLVKDPWEGRRISHTECPRCQSTIFV